MAAALRSESRRARRWPGKRLLTGSDSQVVLGALIKGRSSSKVLNAQLKRALPSVLAYNCYNYTQYVGTGENVADDPTRDRACRLPTSAVASWIAAIDHGDYEGLDSVLRERGVDDGRVARLTMGAEYWSPDVVKRGGQVPDDVAGLLAAGSPVVDNTTSSTVCSSSSMCSPLTSSTELPEPLLSARLSSPIPSLQDLLCVRP